MSTYEQTIADWARQRRRIAAYYLAGHSIPECAREFGLCRTRVSQILDREGVPKRGKHRHHKSKPADFANPPKLAVESVDADAV